MVQNTIFKQVIGYYMRLPRRALPLYNISIEQNMKKIFMTISRGMTARNFLNNDFFDILKKQNKLVIFTPGTRSEDFLNAFSHPNVAFMDLQELKWNFWERMISMAHKILMFSDSIGVFMRYGIPNIAPARKFAPVK